MMYLFTQAEGTLDLERRGITLPPHLRTGTPILSGVKSRTSFKVGLATHHLFSLLIVLIIIFTR